MESEKDIIEANLKCLICLNIVHNPYETTCCGHLFCERCIKKLSDKDPCPVCRNKKLVFRKNNFAYKLLNELDTECPYGCNQKIIYNHIKSHKYQCHNSKFKCSIDNCKFEGFKEEAKKHLIEQHADLLAITSEKFCQFKKIFDMFDLFDDNNDCCLDDIKTN